MSTPTMPPRTTEWELVRQKAARLTNGQLAAEIQRCRHGMLVAANKAAAARFERRLIIMNEEADARMPDALLGKGGIW